MHPPYGMCSAFRFSTFFHSFHHHHITVHWIQLNWSDQYTHHIERVIHFNGMIEVPLQFNCSSSPDSGVLIWIFQSSFSFSFLLNFALKCNAFDSLAILLICFYFPFLFTILWSGNRGTTTLTLNSNAYTWLPLTWISICKNLTL